MRSKLGWKRPPVTDSMRLSTCSRSRKAKNTGVTAPSCTPRSPRNSEMLAMRLSSNRIVRMCWARGGASMLHQLLGGEDERHLVGEAAEPVDAVDERGDLREGAHLGELLVAAVHVAGRRLGPHHLLAVEAHDDAQRAVGGRVLRADVEGHPLGLELDVEAGVGGLAGDVAELLAVGRESVTCCVARSLASAVASGVAFLTRRLLGGRPSSAGHRLDVDDAGPRLHDAGEQREVLAQRVALELGRAGRCCAGRGGRRSRCRTSRASRARASWRRA